MGKFHKLSDGPCEGKNRFYDRNRSEDVIAGLELAIKHTRHRIDNDPDRLPDVFEEHLENLEMQLRVILRKI